MIEIEKFDALANSWWDKNGALKTLHDINPIRLEFIQTKIDLPGKRVLDVGCGGGILSEALCKAGAIVTGIDLAPNSIAMAKQHAAANSLAIDYQCISIEDLALSQPHEFDVITCLELLEHVDDPASIIKNCRQLVKAHGHLFFSTINRNLKAYVLAILGAEYVFNLIPRETHDYNKFIKPSELAEWLRQEQLQLQQLIGLSYNPITHKAQLIEDVSINYLAYAQAIF